MFLKRGILSLPTRERGLKFVDELSGETAADVAPYAGAWIEIACDNRIYTFQKSLPTRERGLKFFIHAFSFLPLSRRSLRGSVD